MRRRNPPLNTPLNTEKPELTLISYPSQPGVWWWEWRLGCALVMCGMTGGDMQAAQHEAVLRLRRWVQDREAARWWW